MLPQPVRAAHERESGPVRVPRQRQSYGGARPSVAPASRSQRAALLLPLVLCGLALLAGAAALGAVAISSAEHTSHSFRLPQSAGTLTRDASPERGLTQRLSSAEQGFRAQFGARLDSVVSAAYSNGSPDVGRPAGSVVFVGAAIDTAGDPDDFVTAFESAARRAGYEVSTVAAGPGAHGVCMSGDNGAATCAWSTGDSVGEVVPAGSGWDVAQLAGAMRSLRTGAEQAAR